MGGGAARPRPDERSRSSGRLVTARAADVGREPPVGGGFPGRLRFQPGEAERAPLGPRTPSWRRPRPLAAAGGGGGALSCPAPRDNVGGLANFTEGFSGSAADVGKGMRGGFGGHFFLCAFCVEPQKALPKYWQQ